MIGNRIGHRLDPFIFKYVISIFSENFSPNLFTIIGFLFNLIASYLILTGKWFIAGVIIIISGLFDIFDGVAARNLNKVTQFGAFLDSVLDRYSDLLLLLGFTIYYIKIDQPGLIILTSIVSIGTILISYIRARAESLNIVCNVGLMERAERIILISVGTFFSIMEPILWIMAILTHFTVFQRIYYVWRKLR